MKRYQYHIERSPELRPVNLVALLNELGAEGWLLVTVEGSKYVFVREVAEVQAGLTALTIESLSRPLTGD